MAVSVRVPTTLRNLTSGASKVSVPNGSLEEVLASLESVYPSFCRHILDDAGQLNRYVNIFINDEDVRFLGGLAASVSDGDTMSIVPAVAGG